MARFWPAGRDSKSVGSTMTTSRRTHRRPAALRHRAVAGGTPRSETASRSQSVGFAALQVPRRGRLLRFADGAADALGAEAGHDAVEGGVQAAPRRTLNVLEQGELWIARTVDAEIGRASCRGRVRVSEGE